MGIVGKKGITIVTLVVTVIILIILTTAVMLTVDDNDMFGETSTTINNHNKQVMIEEIKNELQKQKLEKLNQGDYNFTLVEDIIPIIETFGKYEQETLKLTTKANEIPIYLYEIIDVDLGELVNIEFINNVLTITDAGLNLTENGYKYEYSEDNGVTWKEYTGEVRVTQPEDVKVRLVNTEEDKVAKEESFSSETVYYVTKIEIISAPIKTTYIAGETFNSDGMLIRATYEDNKTKVIRNYQYSPAQSLKVSDKNVEISYTEHGKTVTALQPVTVTNFVERITVATAPTDLTYRQGEMFNASGMVVEATYQDGSKKQVTNYTVTPDTVLSFNDRSVTITYTEDGVTKTTTQNIKVAALDSIAVEVTPTITDYKHGDVFNEAGMTISAIYKYPDGDSFGLPATGWSVANPSLAYGQENVTIVYSEAGITKQTTQNVRVATLDSIAVETMPTIREYKHGDTFDATGMTIRATYKYSDNTTFSSIVTGWTVTNPNITHNQPSVTISYTECGETKTTTQNIMVATLDSIAVETTPTTTVYEHGDTFDATGMTIRATYKYPDNTTYSSIVTGWTVTNPSITYSQPSVTISYTEGGVTKTTTTPITINRILASIAVTTEPTTKTYITGSAFDKTGMVVTAYYSDGGSVALASNSYTVSSPTYGSTSVTVTYVEGDITKTTTVTGLTVKRKFTVTYNYSTNGGTSATVTSKDVIEGDAIDLTPTASKSGWQFVGWNTSSTAKAGLSSLSMSNSNVTLYAIYKKDITVTLYHGLNTSTNTTLTMWNNATSVSTTLSPSAISTISGKSVTGTLKGITTSSTDTTGYSTNYKVSVSSDTTYYAVYTVATTVTYDMSAYSAGTYTENISTTYNSGTTWNYWYVTLPYGSAAKTKAGTYGTIMNVGITEWTDGDRNLLRAGERVLVMIPGTVYTPQYESQRFTGTWSNGTTHIFSSFGGMTGGGGPSMTCSCGGTVSYADMVTTTLSSNTYCTCRAYVMYSGETRYGFKYECGNCGRCVLLAGSCSSSISF